MDNDQLKFFLTQSLYEYYDQNGYVDDIRRPANGRTLSFGMNATPEIIDDFTNAYNNAKSFFGDFSRLVDCRKIRLGTLTQFSLKYCGLINPNQVAGLCFMIRANRTEQVEAGRSEIRVFEQGHIIISLEKGRALGSYTETLVHELGHRFHCLSNPYLNQEILAMYQYALSNHDLFPTQYSTTNHQEYWAECFRYHFCHPGQLNEVSDDFVDQMIQKYKHTLRY